MNRTYDPILETVELKRMRLAAVRSPELGSALVLVQSLGEPVVVLPGNRVPRPRSGNYTKLFRVDIAERGLSFTMSAPSDNAAFPFGVEVSFACVILDPVVIVRNNVRDVMSAFEPSLSATVRRVASRFNALRTGDAEAAITAELQEAQSPSVARLYGFSVRVNVVDVGDIVSVTRENVVNDMRREAMRPVADGGRNAMLAHVMAMNDGDPTPLLDREQAAYDKRTSASLEALRALMSSSEPLERIDLGDVSTTVLETFFNKGGASGSDKPGIRERIERKKLASGDNGASPVVEGSPVDTSTGVGVGDVDSNGDAGPRPDGRRVGRIRGTARPTGDRADGE
jgi:hypothetical protein